MTAGRKINSNSQEWGTPKKYVDAVKEFFGGHIDLDPCSNKYSIVNARTEYMLPEHDGLKEPWDFRTIYVNPPYGRNRVGGTTIKQWLRKCAEAHQVHGSEVLALIPVAANTDHWKKYVFGKATGICFLADTRLMFLVNGLNGGKGAPMACSMVYWGNDFKRFQEIFCRYGAVLSIPDETKRWASSGFCSQSSFSLDTT